MTFREWVEKWQIGPGLNDGPRVLAFVKELRASPRQVAHFGEKELASEQDHLERGLYSGFDGTVGEGWVPILDRLAADLVAMGWDRDLHQVKEKFGTLRFYVGRETDEMEERIRRAEEESARTCEECGQPGEDRDGGWIKTLCDGCEAKRKARR